MSSPEVEPAPHNSGSSSGRSGATSPRREPTKQGKLGKPGWKDGWLCQMEPWCALVLFFTLISQSVLFAGGEFWEDTLELISNPHHGHLSNKQLLYTWMTVITLSLFIVYFPVAALQRRLKKLDKDLEELEEREKAAHAEAGTEHSTQTIALLQEKAPLQGKKNLFEFILDAINYANMMQWDFALRHTFPTNSIQGSSIYLLVVVAGSSLLAHWREGKLAEQKAQEEADKKAGITEPRRSSKKKFGKTPRAKKASMKPKTTDPEEGGHERKSGRDTGREGATDPEEGDVEGRDAQERTSLLHEGTKGRESTMEEDDEDDGWGDWIERNVNNTIDYLLTTLPWLIAMALQAWSIQVIEETNTEHSHEYEEFWSWVMVVVVLMSLVFFFFLRIVIADKKSENSPEQHATVKHTLKEPPKYVDMFRAVDLRNYGAHTSTLLLDALSIGLVDATGDALEISIRGNAQGQGGGFDVEHTLLFASGVLLIGYVILHLTELLRVYVTPKAGDKDSVRAQMQRFVFTLSSRACTYLGGFVVQLSLAEWIIETHAEIMLGATRAHEAIKASNVTLNIDNPNLPDIPPLDQVAVGGHFSGPVVAHSLVVLRQRVLNATSHVAENGTHPAATGTMHSIQHAAAKLTNEAAAFFKDDHVRFEASLIVAFAGFALLITIVGVGLSIITQQISEKYEQRLVPWKLEHLRKKVKKRDASA